MSDVARTIAVPTETLPDGRVFLADRVLWEMPEARQLVQQFAHYWIYDVNRQGYVGARF